MSDPTVKSISVDVMAITGSISTVILGDTNVFYETELLAVVYRFKTAVDSLVTTKVWGWRGKRCQAGEREERKLADLARHYGTEVVRA